MEVGNLTLREILAKKLGDEMSAKVLAELENGIDSKLPAEELQKKLISLVQTETGNLSNKEGNSTAAAAGAGTGVSVAPIAFAAVVI